MVPDLSTMSLLLLTLLFHNLLRAQINTISSESYYLSIYPNMSELASDESTPLYLGLILSLSGDDRSSGALAGVQAALDEINSRDDLLPGYSLHYTLTDSRCNRTAALDGFFTQLLQPPQRKVALMGSGCSAATEATAQIAHYHNIIQISCASSSAILSDKVRFPYYFQLLSSEVNLARVFYSIIKEYGWRRVALIVQNEYRFIATINELRKISNHSEINYSERRFDNMDDLENQLGQDLLFDSQYRIYILATHVILGRHILCKAHALGIKYPKYILLTYGSSESHWFNEVDNAQCSLEELAEALQYSLAVLQFRSLLSNDLFYLSCYDATWTLGLALNATLEGTEINNLLKNPIARNSNFSRSVKELIKITNFTGLSGPVHFDENGVRNMTELRVFQYRTSCIKKETSCGRVKLVEVASINEDGKNLQFKEGDRDKIWPDLIPYYDGTPREEMVAIALPVTVICSALNVCGIICAVICLLFNIIFRKKKLVRLDSPNLNYLIISGTTMVFAGGIVFVVPTLNPGAVSAFCITLLGNIEKYGSGCKLKLDDNALSNLSLATKVRVWLLTIGYSLGFGTVIAKLWRIYAIFRDPKSAKRIKGIKDWHLMLIVIGLVIFDVTTLIVYTVLEGVIAEFIPGIELNRERPKAVHGDLDVETVYFVYTCSKNQYIRLISLGFIYLYVGIYYVCALFFTFKTSKVKIKGLDGAKYIAALVYTTSIVIAITSISLLLLRQYINAYAMVYSFGFWFGNIAILGFLFFPKMVSLYKDPEGNNVFVAHEEAGVTCNTRTVETSLHFEGHDGRRDGQNMDALRQRIQFLEDQLAEHNTVCLQVKVTGESSKADANHDPQ